MGRKAVDKPSLLSDYYVDGKDALTKAQLTQGGPQRLLLRAAGSIEDAATYDAGSSAPQSSDDAAAKSTPGANNACPSHD
jgi:hypothetical protein